ncbi:MAG: DNA-processing protein DprA [Armatimonadota bacterium]
MSTLDFELDERTIVLLRLSSCELPSRRAADLMRRFAADFSGIFTAGDEELQPDEGRLPSAVIERIRSSKWPDEAMQRRFINSGAKIITFMDSAYPKRLLDTYDYPPILYVRGEISDNDRFSVAVVGTRKSSSYGKAVSENLCRELAHHGLTIISGGARGIDIAGHIGALRGGGRTICVLGCGVDVAYPLEAEPLFDQIASQGALVSEYIPGTKPDAWRFPARNRIVAGMAMGVLVIEAPEASGAMITVNYAAEQGKQVFAVPGSIQSPNSKGCHKLLKDGATLVDCAEDVLQAYGINSNTSKQDKPKSLNERQISICSQLSLEPVHIDQLANLCNMDVSDLMAELLMMEVNNLVRRQPGNTYVIVP